MKSVSSSSKSEKLTIFKFVNNTTSPNWILIKQTLGNKNQSIFWGNSHWMDENKANISQSRCGMYFFKVSNWELANSLTGISFDDWWSLNFNHTMAANELLQQQKINSFKIFWCIEMKWAKSYKWYVTQCEYEATEKQMLQHQRGLFLD
jgi:hypothetical protein